MFTKAGDFKVKIVETCLADPKFETAGPNAFDVCLRVETEDNQGDWWHGEISHNYGKGNFASQTQAQITLERLAKLGFQGGNDLSRLDELKGVETMAHVEASPDGKYFNLKWIGTGGAAPKGISMDEAAKRMKAIMGTAPARGVATAPEATTTSAAPVATTAPAATTAPRKSPFAK